MKRIKYFINKWKNIIIDYLFSTVIKNNILQIYKDLQFELQKQATKSSVEFLKKNLRDTPTFSNKFDLISYSIKNIHPALVNGLICEFGVFSGKTINHIAKQLPSKKIYGFDSFEGIPDKWNFLEKGHFKVKKLPKVHSNVTLIKGWFDDTLPVFLLNHPENAALLHIDSDLYSSAKTIFSLFSMRIKPGTVIVFDEFFNYPFWEEGEAKAFFEFIESSGLKFSYLGYCPKAEQLAVIII